MLSQSATYLSEETGLCSVAECSEMENKLVVWSSLGSPYLIFFSEVSTVLFATGGKRLQVECCFEIW